MSFSKERFESGMSTQEYIDQIKVNKDPFVEIYNGVSIPSDAAEWVNGFGNPINLAVFTADWCGDAVSTTPVILRLADSTANVNLQVCSTATTTFLSPTHSCRNTGPVRCPSLSFLTTR